MQLSNLPEEYMGSTNEAKENVIEEAINAAQAELSDEPNQPNNSSQKALKKRRSAFERK